jgi:fructosamine-3-kinase
MTAELMAAVARRAGAAVVESWALAGGDIHQAMGVRLADGRRLFVKTNPSPTAGMFAAEARGLEWLCDSAALRIPEVLAVSDEDAISDEPRFLALEYLEPAPRVRGFEEMLGRGLAAMHRFGAPSFGLDRDNFIGVLPQSNAPLSDWPSFYRERRLLPQLRRAADRGLAGERLCRDFDRLFARLEALFGDAEPPSRLHGDLWGGNLHVDERGHPCLIDPAAYGGHREIDLAMMRLFGGFGGRVFGAYQESWPLAPGAEERVSLHQLYPLLVHLNHFGASYQSAVAGALEGALSAGSAH